MLADLIKPILLGGIDIISNILDKKKPDIAQLVNQISSIQMGANQGTNQHKLQVELEKIRHDKYMETEAFRQYKKDIRLQKHLESEREQLTRKLQHEERLEQYRRETQIIAAQLQLSLTLAAGDRQEIREKFPLKTPAKVILESYERLQGKNRLIPLLVIMSPPGLEFDQASNASYGFKKIELRLVDEVKDFCNHYSLYSNERPIKYQGADWSSKSSHGQSSIDTLHHVLQAIPTLVLESRVDGDFLNIYIACWDMMEELANYQKVLSIPWKQVLYPIARKYAEQWSIDRQKLLESGVSVEELEEYGGDDELNLVILEREKKHEELGITTARDYKYNVKEEKYIRELADLLGICHCILVGLVADKYHFFHNDVRPKLPELIPGLLARVHDKDLQYLLTDKIVSIYHALYLSIEIERSQLVPNLLLDLALSFSSLPDLRWARAQVKASLKYWLKVREFDQPQELDALLEAVGLSLEATDEDYVDKLQECLITIDESELQSIIMSIQAERKQKQEEEKHQREEKQRKEQKEKEQCQREAEDRLKLENISVIHTLKGHTDSVYSLAISRNGELLASGSRDSTIKVWQLSSFYRSRTLSGHSGPVNALVISPNGQILVSGSSDKTIKVWQLSTEKHIRTISGHRYSITSLAISPDGEVLASGSRDNTIRVWQLSTGKLLHSLTGNMSVMSLAISPDGQTLVSGDSDSRITIWQLSTGSYVRSLTKHGGSVDALAISPDGQTLVSGGTSTIINIWHLSTGELLHTLAGDSYSITSLAISPDGQSLVSSSGKAIKVWQLSTGKQLSTLSEHTDSVTSLVITPNGRSVFTGSGDRSIKLWQVRKQ